MFMSTPSMLPVPSPCEFLCPSRCCELLSQVGCRVTRTPVCAEGTLGWVPVSCTASGDGSLQGDLRVQSWAVMWGTAPLLPWDCLFAPCTPDRIHEIHKPCRSEFLAPGQEVMEQG